MSKREFDQLEVLLRVQSGRLRVVDACALLGWSRRQVFRLLRGLRDGGAVSPVSKRRGKLHTLAGSVIVLDEAGTVPLFAGAMPDAAIRGT